MKKLILILLFIPLVSCDDSKKADKEEKTETVEKTESSKSDAESLFISDINNFIRASQDGDIDAILENINPAFFNVISKEEFTQSIELMFNEDETGMKFIFSAPKITDISDRFDFDGYSYHRVYYENDYGFQILNEEMIAVIDNMKLGIENQFSNFSDSVELDSVNNTITVKGLKSSVIASAEVNSNNWKYLEFRSDPNYLSIINQVYPAEVIKELTKL